MKKLLLAASLMALSAPAAAQWSWSSWYAGFGAGQTKVDRELVANRESTITHARNVRTSFDDKDSSWKAFVGYRFTDWLAVELNYADLGEHSLDTHFDGGDPPAASSVFIRREVQGFGADVVLSAPITPRFSIFGRAGLFRSEMDASAQLAGNVEFTGGGGTFRSVTQKENITRYGVGFDFHFAANLAARLEWERYADVGKKFEIGGQNTTGESNIDTASLSVVYRFR